jgi:GT2 family glycosyltransferase
MISSADRLPVFIIHRDQPERCVRTVRAFLDQDVEVEVTVFDNGSSPAAVDHLKRELPGLAVVALGGNRGFGPAANAGLRQWLENGTTEWAARAPCTASGTWACGWSACR